MRTFLALCLLIGMAASAATAANRPHFVWLLSEDNSKHYLKLFDRMGAETPCIEALAQHGLVFEHAFSNSPVCSVARTTLMTGCYAPRLGTQFHRRAVTVPLPNGLQMFPAYLRQVGYYTTNNRKKDYNAVEGNQVWDESSGRATWRNRKPDQPFFHMQSFGTTHESSLHFSAQQMRDEKTQTDPEAVQVAPYHPDTPTFRYTLARYHDQIQKMDAEIGRIVDQLATDGLLEDTFIFYFGDHGGVLPGSKGYIYERGLHVPLVVRVPDNWKHLVPMPRGARVTGFVSFVDFGPTLLKLAGIAIPSEVDGRPFLGPGVQADELNARDEAFGYADRFDEKYDLVRTLRKGHLKYMRSYQPFNFDGLQNNYRYKMLAYSEWRDLFQRGLLNAVQKQFFLPREPEALFDLTTDPHETVNLVGDTRYAAQLVDLRQRLTEHTKGLPDLSFYPESDLVARALDAPVPFGRAHKEEIVSLIEIADLALVDFASAQEQIVEALNSEHPWFRYWALIVCSCHGQQAASLSARAGELAHSDPARLVRVRAAEFLALNGLAEPREVLTKALYETESGIEAALILNSIVLLRDGEHRYAFDLSPTRLSASVRDQQEVQRRLLYLK